VKPLSIAVIGAGHLGRIHTRLLGGIEGFQLQAVVDPNPEARAAIEKEFSLPTLEDYHSLSDSIEAVIVASPTSLHLETTLWCLEHGKHCFVEKPLVRSSRQASMLVQIAERRKRTLQVGHVERFNSAWQAIRPMLDHPIYLESHRAGTYTGRSTDIGVVLDLMIHDIDLILDVVESPLVNVSACGRSVMGTLEDWAEARLEFENGAAAKLFASRVSRTARRSMHVVCENLSAEIDFAKGTADIVESSDAVASGSFRADSLPESERRSIQNELFSKWLPHRGLHIAPANAIEMELRDFLKSIRDASAPTVDGKAAHHAVEVAEKIMEAIHESSERRRLSLEAEQRLDIIPAAHRFGDVRRAS
jgi:predicted dehydrogenase